MAELDELLTRLIGEVGGSLAAAVVGMDGLIVEQRGLDDVDLTALAAELTTLLASGRGVEDRLQAGPLQELLLRFDTRIVYMRLINRELYCLVVLTTRGDMKEARRQVALMASGLSQALG